MNQLKYFNQFQLILQLTKRNVVGRYKGSSLGLLWSFLNPLIMLVIYTFAFSYVFKAKWGIKEESHFDFALILFASLTVFNIFGEVLREAPNLIVYQPNFVKKVVFPLNILPIVSVLSSLIHACFSFFIFFIFYFLIHHSIPITALYLPIILIPLFIFSLGISYLLASLGVFIRDIGHFVGHFVTILLFTSPVFFSFERIPENFRFLFAFNPLALVLEEVRSVIFFSNSPNWISLAAYTLLGSFILIFGQFWFKRTKVAFADYL